MTDPDTLSRARSAFGEYLQLSQETFVNFEATDRLGFLEDEGAVIQAVA